MSQQACAERCVAEGDVGDDKGLGASNNGKMCDLFGIGRHLERSGIHDLVRIRQQGANLAYTSADQMVAEDVAPYCLRVFLA